jgi:DNA-binding HxlR family transcriptional regulator
MTTGDAAFLRRSRDLRHILNYDWISDILVALRSGPLHYSELLATVQSNAAFDPWTGTQRRIQPRVLVRTLRRMEDNGLIVRHEQSSSFPRSVSYTLTHAAEALLPRLEQLASWAEQHDKTITAAQTRYRNGPTRDT